MPITEDNLADVAAAVKGSSIIQLPLFRIIASIYIRLFKGIAIK